MLYNIFIIGKHTAAQVKWLIESISKLSAPCGLSLKKDISIHISVAPIDISTHTLIPAVIFYFCDNESSIDLKWLIGKQKPIIPILSNADFNFENLPSDLKHLNCMYFTKQSVPLVVSAGFECLGLLPKQRRIFLSYRRIESKAIAHQLFEALSARQYSVFLDTHIIRPSEEFQTVLWHNMSDSDVMIMLDTETYLSSRWTAAEFGRAQATGIAILRVGWPMVKRSLQLSLSDNIQLSVNNFLPFGKLKAYFIKRICDKVEETRSKSISYRAFVMKNKAHELLSNIGANVYATGPKFITHATLSNNVQVAIQPHIGIPTSRTLYDMPSNKKHKNIVLYDEIGIHPDWQKHIEWLDKNIFNGYYLPLNNCTERLSHLTREKNE
ncbi:toll/interleukin-1 receptor domain-containing protein [Aeromonas enterica]